MTRGVIFAEPGETVRSLLTRMTDRRIRHLPVCQTSGWWASSRSATW